jgi:LmbE family N-acetylglucosaminyl deacetylase
MTDQLASMPDDWERALAVVAHPDDLEYGAAAAIAAWTATGRTVAYVMLSRGERGIDGLRPEEAAAIRELEQRASAAAVGVDSVEFLDHPDGLIEYGVALRRDIALRIRQHRPELLVTLNHHPMWTGGGWNSPDHRNTGTALLDAAGDAGNRWLFGADESDGPGPWGGVRYAAIASSPFPTHAVDVTATVKQGIASLEAHRAYLDGLGPDHPMRDARAFVERKVAAGARRFGGVPAISFELVEL